MVLYFNKKDLVEFGIYLLSDERRKSREDFYSEGDSVPLDERLKQVYHADYENFLELQRKKKEERIDAKNKTS